MEAVCSDLKGFTIFYRVVEKDLGWLIYSDLKSSPNDFDAMIILISVNIEAFELNRKLITEIGISILDIIDL